MVIYEPGGELLLDTKFAGTLILDFPASRNMRNKHLLFIHPVCITFVYSSPNRLTVEYLLSNNTGMKAAWRKIDFVKFHVNVDWVMKYTDTGGLW